MVRTHRLFNMSVESSIPRLCKSVKTFGRTPASVPQLQVRGESCDIRLTRPYFIRTCHKQLLRNKPKNEIAIAFKFLHEGRLSFLTNLIVIKTLEEFHQSCHVTTKRIHCPACFHFFELTNELVSG